jgi:hypothetical protein
MQNDQQGNRRAHETRKQEKVANANAIFMYEIRVEGASEISYLLPDFDDLSDIVLALPKRKTIDPDIPVHRLERDSGAISRGEGKHQNFVAALLKGAQKPVGVNGHPSDRRPKSTQPK